MFRGFSALALASVLLSASPTRAAPPPIEAYGQLPAMAMVRLSPSGARYAFVADDGHARRLYIATTDNTPLGTLDIGALKVREVEWAGDDNLIVYASTTTELEPGFTLAKDELMSALVLNLKTHKTTQVFARRSDVNPVVFGIFGTAEIAGRWYGYFGGETLVRSRGNGSDWTFANTYDDGVSVNINIDLYQVDLETGDIHIVARGAQNSSDWLVGPDGTIVAHTLYNQKTGGWRVEAGALGGRVLESGHSKLGGAGLIGLGRNGDSVLFQRGGDKRSMIEDLPLSGAAAKTVLETGASDTVIQDPSSRRWIGMRIDGDAPSYTLFSPLFNARVQGALKAFPGETAELVSGSADFTRMIMFTQGGGDSGTYWLVDIGKGSAAPLGGAYPAIEAADVGAVRMVDWKAADGLALRGVLTLPPGRASKGLPLVVMPHGGPEDRDYPGFDFWAQAFASRGYAVFQPNFRGSAGYGLALRDAGFGEFGRKMQTDISDGVAELARQGVVDPRRACIVGGSYGGYAALAGVTLQHGLYRCAVSVAGVADLSRLLEHVGDAEGGVSAAMRYWQAFVGPISPAAISPVRFANQADAPILLIHGKDDTVVPIDQSDAMEGALKAAGKPVERVTITGADHWFLEQDARISMIKASVAFVERHNPPDPPPSAAVAGPANP